MDLAAFVVKYRGKSVDVDHVYGAQCVDLVNAYASEVLHAPPFRGNASDIWATYPRDQYELIANAPLNMPAPGDVVLWGGPDFRVGTSQYGHIAICLTARVADLTTFDQNWPENSLPHEQHHTYDAIRGWLHPRAGVLAPPTRPAGHPPISAADAVDTLRRHAAALTDAPSVPGLNALLDAIKRWPVYKS